MILVRGDCAALAVIVGGRVVLYAPRQIMELAATLREWLDVHGSVAKTAR